MKMAYGWDNYNNGTNSSGFSGLPGIRNYYVGSSPILVSAVLGGLLQPTIRLRGIDD